MFHHEISGSCRAVAAATCIISLIPALTVLAQRQPVDGPRAVELRTHAITGAKVVVSPGQVIEAGTILLRDGVIEAIGADIEVPADARVWPGDGLTVYPGLIDAAVLVDPGEIQRGAGSHWNELIHPELNIIEADLPSDELAKSLRELGFTAAAVYPEPGILRGTGVVRSLAGHEHPSIVYRERPALAAGFDRHGGYPNSLMGSIAAFRQALLDAEWYRDATDVWRRHPLGNEPPPQSDALAALQHVINRNQPLLMEVRDEHDFLRAARILEEFELDGIILGSGLEFRRWREVAATNLPVIAPLDYPDRPDVSTLDAADNVTLETLMNWEQAPTNPRRLIEAGMSVSLTTHGLNDRKDFYSHLRRAINNGLTEEAALAALTTVPAELLQIDHLVGTIEPGKVANFVVVEGSLFDRESKIRDTWIDGRRYEINAPEEPAYQTKGVLVVTRAGGDPIEAPITLDTKKKNVEIQLPDGEEAKAKDVRFDGHRLSFLIDGRLFDSSGFVQFAGAVTEGSVAGSAAMPDRSRLAFTITPTGEEFTPEEDEAPAEGADDDAGPDKDAERGDEKEPADPVSGEWAAIVYSEQIPDGSAPVTFNLKLDENGVITGSIESAFFNAVITGGSFDPATGEISFDISAGEMTRQVTGTITEGRMTLEIAAEGMLARVEATREEGGIAKKGQEREEQHVAPEQLVFPLGEFGVREAPDTRNVVVINATIWTGGADGIIENGWMQVVDGKITGVGKEVEGQGLARFFNDDGRLVEIIDAEGKHVTPGLIDCHSHTGISGGVNEGSQAVTAEVRIQDVIDPDDISWYRELAGGLTAASQLHGSANPIGGQNSVVKLKWGAGAAEFPIQDAIPGIKFALGENVKRSPNRYPNTRMGVEVVIRDAFERALDYREEWQRYNGLSEEEREKAIPPRRDLELEALVEVLEGRRLVHCHSYRQDEVLMLLRVAEQYGFTIGTLQHILEGYKVAEAIAAHGAGASSFSDWWAYKVEVMDAIPYNGALMHRVGAVVSFNSDSSELARRMNTEAAKAVRYGGLDPHEALQFVTLNPAKQLRIDHRTGSLEAGKDADFVIWSGDPLSTYSVCEETWIEGARYFSREEDRKMREQVSRERERLIQTILEFSHGDPDSTTQTKPQKAERAPATEEGDPGD